MGEAATKVGFLKPKTRFSVSLAQTGRTSRPPLFGRFLRQALWLLSSEATKQLPVNANIHIH
jgi:hypothetical protein